PGPITSTASPSICHIPRILRAPSHGRHAIAQLLEGLSCAMRSLPRVRRADGAAQNAAVSKSTRHDHGNRMLHVIGRCVFGDDLFPDDRYARIFWSEVGYRSLEFDVQVLAMCLLGNHYHLIVRGNPAGLSQTMHRALSKLANTRNREEERRRGALVGRRYDVVPCDDRRHEANVMRYVPMNPVLHRLARDPAKWVWSTHAILAGKRVAPDWFDRARVLDAFGFEHAQEYERFVLAGTRVQVPPTNRRELEHHRVRVRAEAGLSVEEIARTTGFSTRHVRRILSEAPLSHPVA
ncbi:MAG: hypothetical protein ACR2J9_08435, partial [Gaiellales bacterium]